MVMDNYYNHPDRLQEIWHQITQLHLSYLELEESTEKLDQRSKLENCIKEYLCLTPHNQKFNFQETSEVLHRSASSKKDFSGYKAAVGWNAIGMYAGNLLSQPWRKEYREIKTYCGFYKHQIEANLVGAEIMFEAMGYKHLGNGIMILEDPICPDRITHVSLDSLIAYVECQILKTIWEEVNNSFEISWLEVLQFRESHLCSPKQSVHSIIYRLNERQYHELNNSRQQSMHQQQVHSSDYYSTPSSRYTSSIHNHSFLPHSHHSQNHYVGPPMQPIPPPPPHCMYPSNNPYCNSYNPYGRYNVPYPVPIPYPSPVIKPQYHTNGYYYPNNGYIPCSVPTGQLIELEQNGMYDVPDSAVRPVRQHSSSHHQQQVSTKSTPLPPHPTVMDKEEGSGTFESWDYVYRNLESQGYNKDLGERGDLLSPPLDNKKQRHSIKEAKKVKATDLDDALHNLTLNNDSLLHKELAAKANAVKEAQSSSYDNVSSQDSYIKRPTAPSAPLATSQSVAAQKNTTTLKSKTIQKPIMQHHQQPVSSVIASSSHAHHDAIAKTSDAKKTLVRKGNIVDINVETQKATKANNPETSNKAKESGGKWECSYCTYLNSKNVEICDMCGKSKTVVPQNLEIGGSQCPACTLVNPKEASSCQACGCSLKDSPTYI